MSKTDDLLKRAEEFKESFLPLDEWTMRHATSNERDLYKAVGLIQELLDKIKGDAERKKYFATDKDKFVFWVEDKEIKFEKISQIIPQEDGVREKAYEELISLPQLDWGYDVIKGDDDDR